MSMENKKNNHISQEIINWLEDFKKKHGRPLKILHIGNIANNAYNNAKLMRKIGLDCDVLCYDYYHIMGCPEWEDADFEGDWGDDFSPDWTKVNLNGFKRPDWFVQGPLKLCIKYLLAKNKGYQYTKKKYWNLLGCFNYTRKHKIFPVNLKKIFRVTKIFFTENPLPLMKNKLDFLNKKGILFGDFLTCLIFIILFPLFSIKNIFTFLIPFMFYNHNATDMKFATYNHNLSLKRLIEIFNKIFPERFDKLSYQDIKPYTAAIHLWRELFKHYDLVHAYATDSIYPMLAGVPYVAFEHGTLREIPFENSPVGRLTALSYHLAEHVFVTNIDCLENAYKLTGNKQKVTFINHPYDEDHGLKIKNFKKLRDELKLLLNAEFLFFFPTRHDWIENSPYSDKGNDIFLKAFCALRSQGFKVGMVCCNWGYDVKKSKKLLKKMNCSKYTIWHRPMNIVKFEKMAKACDIVVDQFKLGSFGGVTFKSLAVGTPVCTYLDKDIIGNMYKELPPVINCRTKDEIIEKMIKLINDPSLLEEIRIKSRDWIKKYHNSSLTITLQLMQYKKIIQKMEK